MLLYCAPALAVDKEISISADAILEKQEPNIVKFSGSVIITNSFYTIHSDYALVQFDVNSPNDIVRMELDGNIEFVQESSYTSNKIQATRCEIIPKSMKIRFFGTSYIVANSKKYPGSVLLYNYDKEKIETIIY